MCEQMLKRSICESDKGHVWLNTHVQMLSIGASS